MCGIAGIFGGAPDDRPDTVARMVAMLSHRGPDGYGLHHDPFVALGHARLSIIDLASGAQPIHNEDRSVWVTFNGEIFNFVELRTELEARGHRFYTHSDTEVLVHLYEDEGPDMLARLNGQFAIAIWDSRRRQLMLARDRIGILPLFYIESEDRVCFASEVKALMAVDGITAKLDLAGLDQLFTFWSTVDDRTVFEGVRQVRPGELVLISAQGITRRTWWDWNFSTDVRYSSGREGDEGARLVEIFTDAVRIRLRSDVPVGAYLSGGLDSSVVSQVTQVVSGGNLASFSIGFADSEMDESAFQRKMSDWLGTRHSSIGCRDNDIAREFPETIWYTESPILRTAPTPMGMLSKLARQEGYKVILTGEGSDEIFGGYDIFKEAKIRQFWSRVPNSTWRPLLLKRLYPYLSLTQMQSVEYLKAFFGTGLDQPDDPFFAHRPRWNSTSRLKEFFVDDIRHSLAGRNSLNEFRDTLPTAIARWHPFHRAQYVEAKTLLPGYLLSSQGDRMLMRNSVEGRFPFLDHRLIEFANGLHPNYKMRALNEKFILKHALGRKLPEAIRQRPKQPYRAPAIPAFFGSSAPDYVREMLDPETIRRYRIFDASRVARLIEKIRRGRAMGNTDNMALVGILSTHLWHKLFQDEMGSRIRSAAAESKRVVAT